MSQRNKLILLGALVLLLGLMAYVQLGRSKEPAPRNESAPPSPATASAPATATAGAAATTADSPQDAGPSAADLRDLAGWFDVLGPTGANVARGSSPAFGIAMAAPQPAAEATPQNPAQIPWATEPGKLDGIVKVGAGPGKAVFQGEFYQVGDRVRGTSFIIVAVDDDFVTLKSGDHVIWRFWHD
ncbi:MAG: hypothetical protein ABSA67_12885 [Candidatus Brocadiia bacterium]|jgi:hypothetical protein